MIKVDYLSEVEALWVKREALIQEPITERLIAVWAVAGRDVHGFSAVVDKVEGDVVCFTPVCDIVTLHPLPPEENGGVSGYDYTKRKGSDLAMFFVGRSKSVDTEVLTGFEPTIGEDILAMKQTRGIFYAIASPSAADEAYGTGIIKGKVGYMVLDSREPAEEQLRYRFSKNGMKIEIILCEETALDDARRKEQLTLAGLRSALKCARGSEWFELPYPKNIPWRDGRGRVSRMLREYMEIGYIHAD